MRGNDWDREEMRELHRHHQRQWRRHMRDHLREHHRFHHRHHKGPSWRYGRTLRGALLGSFISAVVVTGAIVSFFFFFGGERASFTDEVRRVGDSAADAVRSGVDPQHVLDAHARNFQARLVLKRADDVVAEAGAGQCRHPIVIDIDGPLVTDPRVLEVCRPQPLKPPAKGVALIIGIVVMLALMSSAVARRIAWPLRSLAMTARKIGEGDLTARPNVGPYPFVEIRLVADALQDMAERIERELNGSKALLAGASHELRTPLGHLRILVETARENFNPRLLDEIEKEIIDLDVLLEKLLAQARLDFSRIDKREIDIVDVTRRALARISGADPALLRGDAPLIQGDATLLARAIGNLLENAAAHGDGVTGVTVAVDGEFVRVVVDDNGAGVKEEDRARIFEPFVHRSDRGKGSIGLGLHLVLRIAEAHGGSVVVVDKPDGSAGARFVLSLPIAPLA